MKTSTLGIRPASRPLSWMGATTILMALLFLRCADNASATTYTITVPGTVPWTDTGIFIPSGSQLRITASGVVTYGGSPGQQSGPDGGDMGTKFESGSVLSNTVVVSLIGKIGGTTAVGDGTPVPAGRHRDGPGFVGASYNKVILNGGELFLGFNDHTDGFWDNSGSFSVTISVVPAPKWIK